MPISTAELAMADAAHQKPKFRGTAIPIAETRRIPSAKLITAAVRSPSASMRPAGTDKRLISSTEVRGLVPSKRSSPASSIEDEDAIASYPTWVILHRVGARRDSFDGDGTTSAVSYTSSGEQISVSLELAKPPRTSLLTLDWPQGPHPSEGTTSYPQVIAADRNLVLLEINSEAKYPHPAAMDHFVYKAGGGGEPSLTRLPVCYWKGTSNRGNPRPRIMSRVATGILCRSNDFVVAELEGKAGPCAVDIYLWYSGSDRWKVFRDVYISNANTDVSADLCWWSTDAVLPYRRGYLIWIDYFRGMIVGKIDSTEKPLVWYVPFPINPVRGNTYDSDYGRGYPETSRSLCDTRDGIKFISIDRCGSSFSITLWSWCGDQTWRKDSKLDADQFFDLDSENCFPNVQPEFPVVDVENPYVVYFLLNEGLDLDATTLMIKVHIKKKILVDCTRLNGSSSSNNSYMAARLMSKGFSFISSTMPSYLSRRTMKSGRCC
uniref:DUF1618 domain-containing protein n=1 Tax=Leersia perrieri TaxID=77586 RepID=A0A0D9UY40_9ORYZ